MLLPSDLDVDVLVVVLVKRRDGAVVADPEIHGISVLLQGNARPGDILGDVTVEVGVLVSEVIVFWNFWIGNLVRFFKTPSFSSSGSKAESKSNVRVWAYLTFAVSSFPFEELFCT